MIMIMMIIIKQLPLSKNNKVAIAVDDLKSIDPWDHRDIKI
jgi:hypothetical protein